MLEQDFLSSEAFAGVVIREAFPIGRPSREKGDARAPHGEDVRPPRSALSWKSSGVVDRSLHKVLPVGEGGGISES